MRLVITPTIQIGPLTFTIVFSDKLMKKMQDRASLNVKEQIIRLDSETSKEQLFANLIHEIDHAAEDVAGANPDECNTVGKANPYTEKRRADLYEQR